MLFTADLKAFAEKGVKVKKSATTTTTAAIVKKETEDGMEASLEVVGFKAEYEGVVGRDTGVTTTRMKRERRLKVETRDESEDDDGEGVDEDANTKVGKREKRKRKIKTEIKGEEYGEIQEVGVKPITATGKGKGKVKDGVGKKMRTRAKLEDDAKEMPVKEEKTPGKTPKFGDGEGDIELGEAGMTMADRIKRRRRRYA